LKNELEKKKPAEKQSNNTAKEKKNLPASEEKGYKNRLRLERGELE
jgi:hypothetical protein